MAESTPSPTGYTGNILRVNLSNNSSSVEHPDDKFYRTYVGGTALIGYYLLKELKPGIDPLGPDNKLVFAPGLLSGTPLPNTSRISIGAKSPLTGAIKESNAGGTVAAALGRLGITAVVIEEQAPEGELSILKIDNTGNVKFTILFNDIDTGFAMSATADENQLFLHKFTLLGRLTIRSSNHCAFLSKSIWQCL